MSKVTFGMTLSRKQQACLVAAFLSLHGITVDAFVRELADLGKLTSQLFPSGVLVKGPSECELTLDGDAEKDAMRLCVVLMAGYGLSAGELQTLSRK